MYPFQKMTVPEVVYRARSRVLTINPNLQTTAPPAVVVDAEHAQRDVWFAELVARCRAGFVRETTIALCLEECGRSRAELDDALDP